MHPLIATTIATHLMTERHETAARRRRARIGRARSRRAARRAGAAPAPSLGRRLKGAF